MPIPAAYRMRTDIPVEIATAPRKSWLTIFRLHRQLDPWFERSWQLTDIERIA